MTDINIALLAAQIVNVLLLIGGIALTVYALVRLSKTELSADAKTLWSVLIVLVPIIGPTAFLIVMGRGRARAAD